MWRGGVTHLIFCANLVRLICEFLAIYLLKYYNSYTYVNTLMLDFGVVHFFREIEASLKGYK